MKTKYANFDGMRGLAAIAVMLYHVSFYAGWPTFVHSGYLAVDLFFALSGFVIAQAYGDRLRTDMSPGRFAAIRLVRLYPLYLIGLTLGFCVFAAEALQGAPGTSLGQVMAALGVGLFFLPIPVEIPNTSGILPLNGPAWSLFYELGINAAYVLFLPLLTRRTLWIPIVLGALGLGLAAIKFGSLDVGFNTYNFFGGAPRVLFSFCIGVLLYEWRPKPQQGSTISVALLLATALILAAGGRGKLHDLSIVIAVFPLLVWLGARYQPAGRLEACCRWLGRISYPIYVLHLPIFFLLALNPQLLPESPALRTAAWITVLAGIVASADVLARAYDAPVRARLSRLFGLSRPRAAAERGAAF